MHLLHPFWEGRGKGRRPGGDGQPPDVAPAGCTEIFGGGGVAVHRPPCMMRQGAGLLVPGTCNCPLCCASARRRRPVAVRGREVRVFWGGQAAAVGACGPRPRIQTAAGRARCALCRGRHVPWVAGLPEPGTVSPRRLLWTKTRYPDPHRIGGAPPAQFGEKLFGLYISAAADSSCGEANGSFPAHVVWCCALRPPLPPQLVLPVLGM